MIGQTVSHYKILEHLGGGGMGVVYKAEDLELRRHVALKFLPPSLGIDPDARSRFIHEAQAASALDHPNICTIHEIGHTEQGQIFIVMAFYDGETVKKKIDRGPLKLDEAFRIVTQVAEGLAKAHDRQMVHRDIKPANVMITADGVAKVVDFGLAKLAGVTRLTGEGTTVGTVAYMSPEQARGEETDQRTDLWSLGVMLYEMVSGQLPFRGDHESARIYSILNAKPEPLTSLRTGVPVGLDRIVEKALAKRPDERYQHADELLADLRHLQRESGRQPVPQEVPPSRLHPRHRKRTLMISVSAIVLAVAVLLILRPFIAEEMLVSEPRPIAVISFVNQTGDRSYDYLQDAIPNLLITSLEQSSYLRVATWERMRDLLKQLGRKDVAVIDRDLGFELCEKDGIDAIVLGSFVKAGNMFATDVKVLDVHTKGLLKSASARGEGVESILRSQIDQLSREISRGVGLSERLAQSASLPIVEHTTASMDAYNYYLRGLEEYDRFYFSDARRFFLRALAIDTGFAIAYARLGMANHQLGKAAEALEAFQIARRHERRATIKERMKIEAIYANLVQHDGPKFRGILEDMIRLYPKEKEAYYLLGQLEQGRANLESAIRNLNRALELDPTYAEALNTLSYVHSGSGNYEEAIACLQRYASLQPGQANPFDSMGELYYRMGRLDDAIAKYSEALEVRPDFFPSRAGLTYVYGLKGDQEKARRSSYEMMSSAWSPEWKAEILCQRALYGYLTGELGQAMRLLGEATALSEKDGNLALTAACEWIAGWIQFDRGDRKGAIASFRRFLDCRTNSDTSLATAALAQYHYATGRIDIQQGRTDSAKARLDLIRSLPAARSYKAQFTVDDRRARLQAEVLLAEDSVEHAIVVFRNVKPWAIPIFATNLYIYYNVPFDRDFLVRAYTKRGKLDEAIAEGERIAAFDSSSSDRRLIHPRYVYLLATLYERRGQAAEAVEKYRRLLRVWEDADRDLPEYVEARKRLTNLRRRLP